MLNLESLRLRLEARYLQTNSKSIKLAYLNVCELILDQDKNISIDPKSLPNLVLNT